jgi:hypothetical protein
LNKKSSNNKPFILLSKTIIFKTGYIPNTRTSLPKNQLTMSSDTRKLGLFKVIEIQSSFTRLSSRATERIKYLVSKTLMVLSLPHPLR